MRRFFFMTFVMVLAISEVSAQIVTFSFSDGIDDESLKTKIEQNLSLFLTNINKASRQKADKVDLSGVQITAQAKEAFNDLWQFLPFKCLDDTNVQSCNQTMTGYNVRGISVSVTDNDTKETSVRELTIGFNPNNQITGVYFALEQHQVNAILQSGRQVKDIKKRQEILEFIERYRGYYEQKDLYSIEKIFSDTVKHIQTSKQQYINKIRGFFSRKSYVKVKFENIEVIAHPIKDDIYMVRFLQCLNTPGYEDRGYVTFLMQLPNNGGGPRIMVSAWQDESMIKSDESKLIKLDDFKIY